MDANADKLEVIVRELKQSPTVVDAILIGRDGSIIAPAGNRENHAGAFEALCASVTRLSGSVFSRFSDAGPESVIVQGDKGDLLVVDAGPQAVLMVVAGSHDLVEELLVLAEMKSSRIKGLLI